MHGYHGYFGMGGDFVMWLLLIIVVIILVVVFLKGNTERDSSKITNHNNYNTELENAKEIAAKRYAAGEITKEEFEEIVSTLSRKT